MARYIDVRPPIPKPPDPPKPPAFTGRLFADDSIWNRRYDPARDLVIPKSDEMALNLRRQVLRQNPQTGVATTSIGAPWINTGSFTMNRYDVHGNSLPKRQVHLLDYGKPKVDPAGLNAALMRVPIPDYCPPARPVAQEGSTPGHTGGWDGNCAIYDVDSDALYEMWKWRSWYPDGVTPFTMLVTNGDAADQTVPAGTHLTLAKPGGGRLGYTVRYGKKVPAGKTVHVQIYPDVLTNAGATSVLGAPDLRLDMPIPWASSVTAGATGTRHFFLDQPGGGQGVPSCQWGGVMPNASKAQGYYSSPHKYWGVTASSLSVAGGYISKRDLERGEIDHALAMAIRYGAPQIRRPAQRNDSNDTMAPMCPPQGQRFVLDASVNADDPKYARWPILPLLIRAMQRHGIINKDTASNVCFYAEDASSTGINYSRDWFGGAYPDYILKQIPWHLFKAVARANEPLVDRSGNVIPE